MACKVCELQLGNGVEAFERHLRRWAWAEGVKAFKGSGGQRARLPEQDALRCWAVGQPKGAGLWAGVDSGGPEPAGVDSVNHC
jgi:hypothetical protein